MKKAKEKAQREVLTIDFHRHDTRNLPFQNEFDVVAMLCGDGFPFMEADEMNYKILKNMTRALKKHGKFIFTTLNVLLSLFVIKLSCASTTETGEVILLI